jgi:hypothetical protein
MSELLAPQKAERGWIVAMTTEMAHEAGVTEGSYLVFYLNEGHVSAEILPPPTEQTKRNVQGSIDKFKDAFAEMKRLGD